MAIYGSAKRHEAYGLLTICSSHVHVVTKHTRTHKNKFLQQLAIQRQSTIMPRVTTLHGVSLLAIGVAQGINDKYFRYSIESCRC